MDINKIIKMKREDNGWTQKELAEKIDASESAVSRWESGEIDNMRRKNIVALSKVLNIKPEILMGWEEPKEQSKEDKALLDKFHSLTATNQQTILSMIDVLLSQQASEKESTFAS